MEYYLKKDNSTEKLVINSIMIIIYFIWNQLLQYIFLFGI